MSIMEKITEKARKSMKHIVLAEGTEERNINAASLATQRGIAKITLIGNPDEVKAAAKGVDLTGVDVVDPATDSHRQAYIDKLVELRGAKGVDAAKADKLLNDPLYWGVMMVKMGDADGMVSGAIHSTGDVLRPALQIIKAAKGHQGRFFLLPDGDSQEGIRRRRRDGILRLRRNTQPHRRGTGGYRAGRGQVLRAG